jgi:hypothetical protein
MRMWMINPKKLCNKHLLGEHGEIHKHRHNFVKHHSISGRLSPVVQIEPASMKLRHDELAAEMTLRGMNHQSSYEQPSIDHLLLSEQEAKVDTQQSIQDLFNRCLDCKQRIVGDIHD